ncbi:MAG: endonuclease/exonuclease/phosphatase family protein [Rhodocyclaceae bacterium]
MRILTWNIQWGRGADGRVDLDRTIAAVRDMGVPEVLCLQEVAQHFPGLKGGEGGDQVARLAAAFPEHQVCFGPAVEVAGRAGRRARFGNLLLSRLPVLQASRHLLPYPADASVPSMQRGCIEAVIDTAAGPLRVMTTHLEYYSDRQRAAQVQALRELQQRAVDWQQARAAVPAGAAEDNPTFAPALLPTQAVICGDFNFRPDGEDYLAMCVPLVSPHAAWADAWRIAHPGLPHSPTVGVCGAEWPEQPYCCDFFWVSAELAGRVRNVEVNADTPASDHQPVMLELADA